MDDDDAVGVSARCAHPDCSLTLAHLPHPERRWCAACHRPFCPVHRGGAALPVRGRDGRALCAYCVQQTAVYAERTAAKKEAASPSGHLADLGALPSRSWTMQLAEARERARGPARARRERVLHSLQLLQGQGLLDRERGVVEWVKADRCTACDVAIGRGLTVHSRHHCRLCGRSFCDNCSSLRVDVRWSIKDTLLNPFDRDAHNHQVRACRDCCDVLDAEDARKDREAADELRAARELLHLAALDAIGCFGEVVHKLIRTLARDAFVVDAVETEALLAAIGQRSREADRAVKALVDVGANAAAWAANELQAVLADYRSYKAAADVGERLDMRDFYPTSMRELITGDTGPDEDEDDDEDDVAGGKAVSESESEEETMRRRRRSTAAILGRAPHAHAHAAGDDAAASLSGGSASASSSASSTATTSTSASHISGRSWPDAHFKLTVRFHTLFGHNCGVPLERGRRARLQAMAVECLQSGMDVEDSNAGEAMMFYKLARRMLRTALLLPPLPKPAQSPPAAAAAAAAASPLSPDGLSEEDGLRRGLAQARRRIRRLRGRTGSIKHMGTKRIG